MQQELIFLSLTLYNPPCILLSQMTQKVNTSRFYFEYKGHQIDDIATFFNIVTTQRPDAPIVYLAGDSSLDNKYWLPSTRDAVPTAPVPEVYKLAAARAAPKSRRGILAQPCARRRGRRR